MATLCFVPGVPLFAIVSFSDVANSLDNAESGRVDTVWGRKLHAVEKSITYSEHFDMATVQ